MNFLRDMTGASLPLEFDDQYFKNVVSARHDETELKVGTCKSAWVVATGKDFAKVHQLTLIDRFTKRSFTLKGFRDMDAAEEWLDIPADYALAFDPEPKVNTPIRDD